MNPPRIPNESSITLHASGATSVVGRDAMSLYRAITLNASLKLWKATKMIPTRGVTITVMLGIAKEFTGKDYKRSQVDQCMQDLQTWIDTMKAAMPVKDERKP